MTHSGSERAILVGLIGAGIQRSLTPAMHEEEARAQCLRLNYQLIDLDAAGVGAEKLPVLIEAARMIGFAGLNITYPCKQAVIPLLDELSDEAAAMGAVNTVVFDRGRAVGHNTDGSGWAWGFERALPGADLSRVVLLGAGGAGSAIAHAVLRMGAAQLRIVDAEPGRADRVAAALASDEYDARGQIYRAGFAFMAPSYDLPAPYTDMFATYDLIGRTYSLTGFIAETGGMKHTKPLADREWTADALAGAGIR